METIKLSLFFEFIALFVCTACHLLAFIIKIEFPISMYFIIPSAALVCILLANYIIVPIAEWFLS